MMRTKNFSRNLLLFVVRILATINILEYESETAKYRKFYSKKTIQSVLLSIFDVEDFFIMIYSGTSV